MLLEVIGTCIDDVLAAAEHGADRIELITAVTEGGLTPGIGLVQQAVAAVDIPIHVMVRPHSRSFVYSPLDIATMAAEVQAIAAAGAAGVVLGALTADGRIDEQALETLLPLIAGMQVTFHRAFDELADQMSGIRLLMKYPQITRVLTSGGQPSALDAMPQIRELVRETGGSGLRILAGAGLTIAGISSFIRETGVSEVHFGSAVRMDSNGLAPIDPERLRGLADQLHDLGTS